MTSKRKKGRAVADMKKIVLHQSVNLDNANVKKRSWKRKKINKKGKLWLIWIKSCVNVANALMKVVNIGIVKHSGI